MKKNNLKKIIKDRQSVLRNASIELKKHFVGIDSQIDAIIKSITVWYCYPDLLTRPVIISLWGTSGVGKTDLVRRLVKLLSFNDRFCEIEMMNKGDSSIRWHRNISAILEANSKIASGQPAIVLLDEMQNFRTLGEDGRELAEYKYRDVWSFLSDGKLPFRANTEYLLQLLWDYNEKERKETESKIKEFKEKQFSTNDNKLSAVIKKDAGKNIPGEHPKQEYDTKDYTDDEEDLENGLYDDDEDIDLEDDDEIIMPPSPPVKLASIKYRDEGGDDYYSLKDFKRILRLPNSLQEIATWSISKKKNIIIDRLNDQDFYEEINYTKSLVFISGNLDEAYEFAKNTDEVDIDADIFHELSKKINILDIKKALESRFKPEQIARFGNVQVIYPTLSKKSYETIIERKISDIIINVKRRCKVDIEIDKSINELIYQNGVFPTQGTRPVFSTISEVIESSLPSFLLPALTGQKKRIKMFYDNNNICAKIGNKIVKSYYRGALDKLKDDRNKNFNRRTLNAVHEAGHAVIYALLLKCAPPQISALPIANDIGGFVWVHEICGSKKLIEDKICTMLAGGVAERLIFGQENLTWGLQEDLHEATRLVGAMVKRYGMKGFSSFIMHPTKSDMVNNDLTGANSIIEKTMSNIFDQCEKLLKDNMLLLKDVIDFLLNNRNLSPQNFKKICSTHGLNIIVKNSEDTIYADYHRKYQSFKKGT